MPVQLPNITQSNLSELLSVAYGVSGTLITE